MEDELRDLASKLSREEFLKVVFETYGFVESVAKEFLVAVNEYSVHFGTVVKSPLK